MDLLPAGVRRSVIALWLGHESVETTQTYLEATLATKLVEVVKDRWLDVRQEGKKRIAFHGYTNGRAFML
jgi:integrase